MVEEVGKLVVPVGEERVALLVGDEVVDGFGELVVLLLEGLVVLLASQLVVLHVDDEVVEEVEKIVVLLVERLVLVAEVEIVELSVLLVDDLWSARSKGS